MLDSIIRGGTVVDGTGVRARRADVGIKDGKVTEIGRIRDSARHTIEADGQVVAPGFIDVHTHYDAQVMWDPSLSPSLQQGVTTVLGGNCGFTIAPVDETSSDYVMRMLACVEGMPVASLEAALEFRWRTFAEWLAQVEGRIALNAGFMVGHSTIRPLVMGADWKRAATQNELNRMMSLVDESVAAGALGFSSSWGEAHGDHLGNPVPSRFAEAEELIALAGTLRRHPGTTLEFIPGIMPRFTERSMDVMADMSVAAGRALNWNILSVGTGVDEDAIESRLSSADRATARGGRVVGLALPVTQPIWINLTTMLGFNAFPTWRKVNSLPSAEKLNALRDPAIRAQMAQDVVGRDQRHIYQFAKMSVQSVTHPRLKPLEGRSLADLAAERGCTALDVFLDVTADDNLKATFMTGSVGDDEESWKLRAKIWSDPRVIVGASDAGAHIDTIATYSYFSDLVGPSVRERRLLTIEDAVHKMTDQPARFYGLRNRGRLAPGYWADVVIFDADRVGPGRVELRYDMPGEQPRLYSAANGIERVLVNGVEVLADGSHTGALPGNLLRSGRDTGTGA